MRTLLDERRGHLKLLIDDVVNTAASDYFIPQMVQHAKSASLVPERICEIFWDFYESELSDFERHIQTETSKAESALCLLHAERPTPSQTSHVSPESTERQEELARLTKAVVQKKNLVEHKLSVLSRKICQSDQEMSRFREGVRKISISLQSAEITVQNGRTFINEIRKSQQFEVRQMKRSLSRKNWEKEIHNLKGKIRAECGRLAIANTKHAEALSELRRMLGDGNSDKIWQPEALVNGAVQAAKSQSTFAPVVVALGISETSMLPNEAIGQEIAEKVNETIEASERELKVKLDESRRRQKDLQRQLHGA
jgi:hypothetical protein